MPKIYSITKYKNKNEKSDNELEIKGIEPKRCWKEYKLKFAKKKQTI